jgi:hypothetical protein
MSMSFRQRRAQGASTIEALIAVPVVLVACLLTLQMMLLYRAKIALNYATQEAARVGSMSNGRVVPRFLTDVTQFSTVFRRKPKCVTGAGAAVPGAGGGCPSGSTPEAVDPALPTSGIPGASTSADGSQPTGGQFDAPAADSAGTPPPAANAADAAAARNPKDKGAGAKFAMTLGRGMLRYGDSSVLQGFINGIMPLYSGGTQFLDVAKGQLAAYGDAMMNSCIIYHSPTQAAFLDFGFAEVDGPDKFVLQIPNDLLRYRIPGDLDPKGKHIGYYKEKGRHLSDEEPGLRGELSSMSVQDATLLSIEIKYSSPMKVPIAREILVGLARLYNNLSENETAMGREFINFSLDHGRWPMSGFATYRMQTPVHWHVFYPFGRQSNIRSSQIEAFDGIQALWNLVTTKVNDTFDPAEPQIGFCPGLLIDKMGGEIGDKMTTDTWVGKPYDTHTP